MDQRLTWNPHWTDQKTTVQITYKSYYPDYLVDVPNYTQQTNLPATNKFKIFMDIRDRELCGHGKTSNIQKIR